MIGCLIMLVISGGMVIVLVFVCRWVWFFNIWVGVLVGSFSVKSIVCSILLVMCMGWLVVFF